MAPMNGPLGYDYISKYSPHAYDNEALKMASPLPDIDGIVRRVAKHKYRSLMDGKEFFEQIRVIPTHVPRTAMTTPATCQALMNHLFAPYIGQWMDMYLDDIVIYSDSLSRRKLRFLEKELKVLSHIINNDGIQMDPTKVDSVLAWKVPTNRDLLRGFLSLVGYLADDLARVRVPGNP